jgi:hypothetical protein
MSIQTWLGSMVGHIDDVQVPDLETSYSRFPNTHHFQVAMGLKDQSIREVINDREQQSHVVLHDISDLETIMEKITNLHHHLVEKHDKITQSNNLHKGLLSPLWRLPAEILARIFVNCLPETYYFRVSPKLAPLLLIWICRRWRDVAVDMSSNQFVVQTIYGRRGSLLRLQLAGTNFLPL